MVGHKGHSVDDVDVEDVDEEDDEILVDIETTEDDDVQLKASPVSRPTPGKEMSPKLYSRTSNSSGHSTPTTQILLLDPNNNINREVSLINLVVGCNCGKV